MQDGIYLFGGLYTGFALPLSAQRQAVWDVPAGGAKGKGEPGSWGGHATSLVAYDARGLTCVTWGALQRMTWPFFKTYCDEAYAIVSQQFLSATTKRTPAGFDLATLRKDLALVKGWRRRPRAIPCRWFSRARFSVRSSAIESATCSPARCICTFCRRTSRSCIGTRDGKSASISESGVRRAQPLISAREREPLLAPRRAMAEVYSASSLRPS